MGSTSCRWAQGVTLLASGQNLVRLTIYVHTPVLLCVHTDGSAHHCVQSAFRAYLDSGFPLPPCLFPQAYMRHVQANAEHVVRDMLRKVARKFQPKNPSNNSAPPTEPAGPSVGAPPVPRPLVTLAAEDFMDDGSRVCLRLSIDGEKGEAHFDFAGTGPEVLGNWNAPGPSPLRPSSTASGTPQAYPRHSLKPRSSESETA